MKDHDMSWSEFIKTKIWGGDPEDQPQFADGLAAVESEGQWGYIDEQGNMRIKPSYDYADAFVAGTAIVRRGWQNEARYGLIDCTGRIVIPVEATALEDVGEGRLAVTRRGKARLYDRRGKPLGTLAFDSTGPEFKEGLISARAKGKWGYVNLSGQWEITPRFAKAAVFSEGLAAVKDGRHWGYINKKGDTVIQPRFENAGEFLEGQAFVDMKEDKEAPIIDREGRVIGHDWWC